MLPLLINHQKIAKMNKKLTELQSTALVEMILLVVSVCFSTYYLICRTMGMAFVMYSGFSSFSFQENIWRGCWRSSLNGGAYNVLLNTATKRTASLAATLTILSYMATAVISASEAMHYMSSIFKQLPVLIATVVVLVLFCILTISGIGSLLM
jgi:hypothetical protein